jgi:cytochrome bd-type quinol oxidase subunit 2
MLARAMYYNLWVFLHVASVLVFLSCHGGSMFVAYRIRGVGGDRTKIEDLLAFSGTTVRPMYISLVVLVVFGVVAGIKGQWFHYWWIWAAIGILLVTTGLMTAVARPYFKRVTAACAMRPSGVPRASDEELAELLRGPTTHIVSAIGTLGLLAILYLMIFKPGV